MSAQVPAASVSRRISPRPHVGVASPYADDRDLRQDGELAARARIADYDAQMSRYRASIDAGGDPAVIGPWIAETQAKKVAAQAEIRTAAGRTQMSWDDIAAIVSALGELATVVREADPADKADIYAKLKLTLTYQPEERIVEASIKPA